MADTDDREDSSVPSEVTDLKIGDLDADKIENLDVGTSVFPERRACLISALKTNGVRFDQRPLRLPLARGLDGIAYTYSPEGVMCEISGLGRWDDENGYRIEKPEDLGRSYHGFELAPSPVWQWYGINVTAGPEHGSSPKAWIAWLESLDPMIHPEHPGVPMLGVDLDGIVIRPVLDRSMQITGYRAAFRLRQSGIEVHTKIFPELGPLHDLLRMILEGKA